MERFVVFGIQRTGTSLVVSTLRSHESIWTTGEAFIFGRGRGKRLEGSYRRYIDQRKLSRTLAHYFRRQRQVYEYLDQLFARPGHEAVGFKLMLSQTRIFPMVIDYLRENKIKILTIIRHNILKTLVSRTAARKRKLYHSEVKSGSPKIRLSTSTLHDQLRQIGDDNRALAGTFPGNPCLTVSYEAFTGDRSSELRKILEFLNQEYQSSLSSPWVKVNPHELEDIIENYDEVASCLAGTEYEVHL